MKNLENISKINELLKITPNKNIQSVDEHRAKVYITKDNAKSVIQIAINLCNEPVLDFVKDCIDKDPKCVMLEKNIVSNDPIYSNDTVDSNITVITYQKHVNLLMMSDLIEKRIKLLISYLDANKKTVEQNNYMVANYHTYFMSDDSSVAELNMKITGENMTLRMQADEMEKQKKKWEEMLNIVKKAEKDIGIKDGNFQEYKEDGWTCDYNKDNKTVILTKQEKKAKNGIQEKIEAMSLQIDELSKRKTSVE